MIIKFFVLFFLILKICVNTEKRVAIIGAGIGGTSAGYFLLKNNNISVDIFESRERVGGRVFSKKILNETTNLGASFLLKENEVIFNMINELNLSTEYANDESEGSIGIFNNRSILLTLGENDFINIIKVIWRYGIFSPLRARKIIQDHLKKFQNVYNLLNQKITFSSLHELLQKTEMEYLINSTIGEYLKQHGVSEKYVDELYNAVIAGIYNQHQEVNSYAGFVALIGSSNSPLHIIGGNDMLIKKIVERCFQNEKFNLFLNSTILQITRENNSLFTLTDNFGRVRVYDYVIIACPLKQTNITFNNIIIKEKNYYPDKFVAPFSVFIKGTPRPEYFNWQTYDILPHTLISTDKHKGIIIQIARYKDDVYRLVSETELTEEIIESLGYFKKGSKIIFRHHWKFAYPAFEKFIGNIKDLPEFVLDRNLYYVNAIEAAASCMELSMISVKNIVNIIENELSINNN